MTTPRAMGPAGRPLSLNKEFPAKALEPLRPLMVFNALMVRPCFLVVDREFPGSISTRKLVIETAKLNVLTAYSGQEALETFKRFPAVTGVVLDGGLDDLSCAELARRIKLLNPAMPIVVIAAPGFMECPDADYQLESFDPAKLLETLKSIKPREYAEIENHNEEINGAGR